MIRNQGIRSDDKRSCAEACAPALQHDWVPANTLAAF